MSELVCARAGRGECRGRLEIVVDPWVRWVGSGEEVLIVLCPGHVAEAEDEV